MNVLVGLFNVLGEVLALAFATPAGAATAVALGCACRVRKARYALTGVVIAGGLAWTGHPVLAVLVAVALVVAWLVDCARYGERNCYRCGGDGRFSRVAGWSPTSRTCPSCGGACRKPRWGTRLLNRVFGDRAS